MTHPEPLKPRTPIGFFKLSGCSNANENHASEVTFDHFWCPPVQLPFWSSLAGFSLRPSLATTMGGVALKLPSLATTMGGVTLKFPSLATTMGGVALKLLSLATTWEGLL